MMNIYALQVARVQSMMLSVIIQGVGRRCKINSRLWLVQLLNCIDLLLRRLKATITEIKQVSRFASSEKTKLN